MNRMPFINKYDPKKSNFSDLIMLFIMLPVIFFIIAFILSALLVNKGNITTEIFDFFKMKKVLNE